MADDYVQREIIKLKNQAMKQDVNLLQLPSRVVKLLDSVEVGSVTYVFLCADGSLEKRNVFVGDIY